MVTFQKTRRESNCVQVGTRMCICWNADSCTLEHDTKKQDRIAPSVIAQQCSSLTLPSLQFYSRESKYVIFSVSFTSNCANLEFHKYTSTLR